MKFYICIAICFIKKNNLKTRFVFTISPKTKIYPSPTEKLKMTQSNLRYLNSVINHHP